MTAGAILLAAGRGSRFDPGGRASKLRQRLPDGRTVVAASAARLLAAGLPVLAVVRPDDGASAALLSGLGCTVLVCPDCAAGMGASLAHGARAALALHPAVTGWLVALGDMPAVAPSSIALLLDALAGGAPAAVPVHAGRRGHPVAFGAALLPQLARLQGDQGGRAVLAAVAAREIAVDDPGVLLDVDFPADLNALTIGPPGPSADRQEQDR